MKEKISSWFMSHVWEIYLCNWSKNEHTSSLLRAKFIRKRFYATRNKPSKISDKKTFLRVHLLILGYKNASKHSQYHLIPKTVDDSSPEHRINPELMFFNTKNVDKKVIVVWLRRKRKKIRFHSRVLFLLRFLFLFPSSRLLSRLQSFKNS